MKKIYLISDIEKIVENALFWQSLKENIELVDQIFFIPSTPKDRNATLFYVMQVLNIFKNKGINFKEKHILNYENIKESTLVFARSNVVFLLGGDILEQNKLLKVFNTNTKKAFETFDGTIIGMSSGALNMCEKIDFQEDNTIIKVDGLGLLSFRLQVHYKDGKHFENNMQNLAYSRYGIRDEGAILVENTDITLLGDALLIEKST